MLSRPSAKPPLADDLLEELPPLDDDENEESNAMDLADLGPMAFDEDKDRDDKQASNLDIGELVEQADERVSGPDDETVGPKNLGLDLLISDSADAGECDEATGIADEDVALGIDDIQESGLDASEEEGGGASADDIDEGLLPELDSDNEADMPDELLMDGVVELTEVSLPAWAERPWRRLDCPLIADPIEAICLTRDEVIAGGQGLFALRWSVGADAEALAMRHSQGTLRRITALCEKNNRLFFVGDGQLLESDDGGLSYRSSALARRTAYGPRHLCAFGSEATVLLGWNPGESASILGAGSRDSTTGRFERILGAVADQSGAWMLGENETGLVLYHAQENGAARVVSSLGKASLHGATKALLSVNGPTLLVASPGGSVLLSTDAGRSFQSTQLPAELRSVALATIHGTTTILVCVYLESEDKSYLLVGSPTGGFERVAELTPHVSLDPHDGNDEVAAGMANVMAWDESRTVLWIGGAFGLMAWRPASLV